MSDGEDEISVIFDVKEKAKEKNRNLSIIGIDDDEELQLRPGPGFDSCFICRSLIHYKHKSKKTFARDIKLLIENRLEFPKAILQDYIEKNGPLNHWINLCHDCIKLAIEGRQVTDQIMQLELKLRAQQQKIVEIIKSTFKSSETEEKQSNLNEKNINQGLASIRKYVNSRDYLHVQEKSKKIVSQKVIRIEKKRSTTSTTTIVSADKLNLIPSNKKSKKPSTPMLIDDEDEILIDDDNSNSNGGNSDDNLQKDPLETSSPQKHSQVFYCGLCDDFTVTFASEAILVAHQKEVHGPPPLSSPNDSSKKKSRPYVSYRYSCPNCPEVKNYQLIRYSQHLAIHQRRPFQCTKCLEFLPPGEDLHLEHWKTKHGDTNLPFSSHRFLRIQLNPGTIFKCDGCYAGFTTEKLRRIHEFQCEQIQKKKFVDSIKAKPVNCKTCSRNFRNESEWKLHRQLEHPEVDSISCFLCDEIFASKVVDFGEGLKVRNDAKLLEHLNSKHKSQIEKSEMKIHEECEACGIVFHGEGVPSYKKVHDVDVHGVNPVVSSPYPCQFCEWKFEGLKALRLHMTRVHFPKDDLICDNCGAIFKSQSSYDHHIHREHGQLPKEGAEVYSCPQEGCGYTSVVKEKIRSHNNAVHVRVITLPYKCKWCEEKFKDSQQVKAHSLKFHEEEFKKTESAKPYVCDICGKSFSAPNQLSGHYRTAHEEPGLPPQQKKLKKGT